MVNSRNSDTSHRTDESDFYFTLNDPSAYCNRDPTFRCEEHSCQSNNFRNFVCGDGMCDYENGECQTGRGNLIVNDMLQIQFHTNDTSINCRTIIRCVTWQSCPTLCSRIDICTEFIQSYCEQSLFAFPDYPILFGHVRLIFSKDRSPMEVSDPLGIEPDSIVLSPEYVCYNAQLCEEVLPVTTVLFENYTCRPFDSKFDLKTNSMWFDMIVSIKKIFQQCLTIHDKKNSTDCRYPSLYRCINSSKCISKYRLRDGVQDCPKNDDETISTKSNTNTSHNTANQHVSYYLLCDGYIDMEMTSTTIETDETYCNWWPCNNIYTRCDHIWNCHNGDDEINCTYFSPCPSSLFPCILPHTYNLTCLSSDRAGDGLIDCLGASDERHICRKNDLSYTGPKYRCWNDSLCLDTYLWSLCDGKNDCPLADDELICDQKPVISLCMGFMPEGAHSNLAFFCQPPLVKTDSIFLFLQNIPLYPEQNAVQYHHYISQSTKKLNPENTYSSIVSAKSSLSTKIKKWNCNRGIHILIRSKNLTKTGRCLCPPGYYGYNCQYQSQRISLTLQIKAETDWKTTFALIITLIDQQQIIESFEQISYLASRDCDTKYTFNLLYSTQPKNLSKNYSVRIDAYDKHTLTYRTSWIYPIRFSFLLVYKITTQLIIPKDISKSCSISCNHGRCIRFSNENTYACQCDSGWSGAQCHIPSDCSCAPGSLCVTDGSSEICLCPLNKYGRHCYLLRSTCLPYACNYRGQCIETDHRLAINNFTCICNEGFFGETCQYVCTKIVIHFHEISIPSSILTHFITAHKTTSHTRTTTIKRIPPDQDSITIYKSNEFHLLFTEFASNYYLTIAQEQAILSAMISTNIRLSQRCFPINDLINSSVLQFESLRRIKLYSMLCQERLQMKCFYDEKFMCLCNIDRFANCFEFNHSLTYICYGNSICQNGGQCSQDK